MRQSATTEPATPDAPVPPADVDAPPRNKGGRPPKVRTDPDPIAPPDKSAGGRPSNQAKLAKSLTAQYAMIGTALMMFAPKTGAAVRDNATECADSLAAWAENNERVRKALSAVNNAGGLLGVVAAHAPIVMAAMAEITTPKIIDTTGTDVPAPVIDMGGLFATGGPVAS